MRVLLPSNASMKHYPNNSIAEYTVKLPSYLDFSKGSWEVGLLEISFYKSWSNVKDAHVVITKKDNTETIVSIPDGYYDNLGELCETINQLLPSKLIQKAVKFIHDKYAQTVLLKISPQQFHQSIEKIDYSPSLDLILGDKTAEVAGSNVSYPNPKLPKLHNIMIYSDVVSSSIVGDVETNLLRCIPITGDHWSVQHNNFIKVQYLPVRTKKINQISVFLYTDYGERVPFSSGRTILTLDFRRIKPLILS